MKKRVNMTITIGLETIEKLEVIRKEKNYPISRLLEDCFLEVYGDDTRR